MPTRHEVIRELVAEPDAFRRGVQALRDEWVYNLGSSAAVGADAVRAIADRVAAERGGSGMSEPVPVTRRRLLRWVGWFAAANIGLFLLVGLRYLFVFPFNDDLLGNLYLPLAYAGQMALLASLPLGLVLIPLLLALAATGPRVRAGRPACQRFAEPAGARHQRIHRQSLPPEPAQCVAVRVADLDAGRRRAC